MSRSTLAAEHKHRTGCSYSEAARLHGLKSAGPVAREYKRIYEGRARVRKDYVLAAHRPGRLPPLNTERLTGAVAFMRRYSTTAEKAARVFGVPQEEIEALVSEQTRRAA